MCCLTTDSPKEHPPTSGGEASESVNLPAVIPLEQITSAHSMSLVTGAYELPKVAKERATTVYARVPSKYKIELATVSVLGKCASIRD